jgi:hypothetical protein
VLSAEEKRRRNNERTKLRNKTHPNEGRNIKYKRAYGITVNQYEEFNHAFGGVCHICGNKCASGRRLAVDHSHQSGLIRGLLCINCNKGIGNFKDNKDLLQKAIDYLKFADETEEFVNATFQG